jgi:hypothetical protein
LKDFVAEGNDGVGTVMSSGGHIRGLTKNISVFPFDYISSKDLKSSQGAELRVWLENDIAHSGEYGTVTAYCLVDDE